MPISVYVPALTFNQVTGINLHLITPIVCVVCTIYTCIGGIKGVVWTDVLQSFIMLGSMLLVIVKGTVDVGGIGVVYERNLASGRIDKPDFTLDPTVRMGFFAVFVGGAIFKLQGTCISQPAVQRFLSLPNMKAVKKALIVFTLGLIFLLSMCIYIGMLAYAAYYDCDPITTKLARAKDQVVPLYVMEVAGVYPGVTGLFVSGVFSAALSSLSTALNSLSGVILKDFIEPYCHSPLSERQTAIILRSVVVIFGLFSMAMVNVVEKLGMVMQLSATIGSMTCGPLLGIFTVGMLLPFVKTNSVLTGCSIATSIMGYIAVRAQIAIATGEIKYPIMPVSVEGCTYNFTIADPEESSIYEVSNSNIGIHHISFLWYTLLGSSLTIGISLLATVFFGAQDTSEVDDQLVVPFIRRFMKPQKYECIIVGEILNGGVEKGPRKLKNEFYFEKRFSRRLRIFGATLFTFKAIIWLPIAVYVPALTFNQVTGIDIHSIAPVVIVICTFYTTVGGIKGVVWTDVIQSFVMFGSIIVLMIKGTYEIGGFGVVWQRSMDGGRIKAPEVTFDPTVRMSIFSVFVGGTFFKLQNTSINQPAIQRFMSLPSLKQIKQTLYIFSIGVTLLYLCCVYVGLLTFATYYDCDPMSTGLASARDQLVPLLVMRILGVFPGLPGLFVAGVFSASLSSLSTLLNSLSAIVLEDFVKPNVKEPLSERTTAIIMRTVVVVFGMSSMGLIYVVEKLGMVMQLSATLQSILYGPMLGIFTVGVLMPWVNEKSCLIGSVISFLTMGWICISAQIANVLGTFRHAKLPVSIEGCDYNFNMERYLNSTAEYQPSTGTAIHHISFLWYTTLGASLTIICSNIATMFFGRNDINKVDERLLAPFLVKFLKKNKYTKVKQKDNFEMNYKLEIE